MNEKTKKILSYIACALGGMALGVALLGGLSMCSTSKEAEAVNTITATKKNAVITTDGGYSGYEFSVSPNYPTELGSYNYITYSVDLSTYTLTELDAGSGEATNMGTFASVCSSLQESQAPTVINTMNFLAVFGYADYWGSSSSNGKLCTYFSFLHPQSLAVRDYAQTCFILTTNTDPFIVVDLTSLQYLDITIYTPNYFISTDYTPSFLLNTATNITITSDFVFQDVASYYRELGYQDGYTTGYEEGTDYGYSSGYEVGYSEGYEYGNDDGYASGYQDGLNSSNFFGSITATNTATEFSYLSNSEADYYTDYVAYFKVASAIVGETDYYIWLYGYSVSTWSYRYWYLVFAPFDGSSYNMTQSYAQQYELGHWLVPIDDPYTSTTSSVYNRKTNNYDDSRLTGITNLDIFNELVVLDDYKSAADYYEEGYNLGYENGEAIGSQAGYTTGYQEGFTQTNTNNVFSLFTSAFSAVGDFFSLEVFGFLPLYWFFLVPLFVTLITLLLRMVKH